MAAAAGRADVAVRPADARRPPPPNTDDHQIIEYAIARSYTAVIVLNEDRKVVNGLLHINLPAGPTAYYKLTNLKMPKEIHHHGRPTDHRPEIILNKFSTRMGHRVAHMFASLFSPVRAPRPPAHSPASRGGDAHLRP